METQRSGRVRSPLMATARAFDWPHSLSVLAVTPTFDDGHTAIQLIDLAAALGASGHRLRLVGAPGSAIDDLRASEIPFWPVRRASGRLHLAGELAVYGKAIYQALCAETTHVIHSASLRMTQAALLATFTYTLRHPCTPEPAIVTTICEDDGCGAVYARGSRRLRLPGDCVIVSSEQARDAFLGGTNDQRLRKRVHAIAAGDDLVAATVAVYQIAWERRQRENERALLPITI